jgi:thioesterase domain-containing protein
MSLSSRLRQARGRLRSRGLGPGGAPAGEPPAGNLFAAIVDRNRKAVANYAAAPLPEVPGRVTVFLAEETSADALPVRLDERCGWGRLARGGMEVRRVPGNHLSMLEPPHAAALAEAVRAAMDEALALASRSGGR